MTRRDKLVARFKSKPTDFTWEELFGLLRGLGYDEAQTGKTGGSRRRFVHPTAPAIALHKPHPGKIVKIYVVRDVLRLLIDEGLI
ncbi:MAG: type II toxin-antitoxin system HicA family toxin [Tagaea sp.]